MWVRRSAIRSVPRYARVPAHFVVSVEAVLDGADDTARQAATDAYERLASQQPALFDYVRGKLPESMDEKALALGHMLGVAVLLVFEAFAGRALLALSTDAVAAVDAALTADEELRREDPLDELESEDIVAIEQPALLAFVNEQVGLTLSQHAESIDVDHVAIVFRTILVEILALSHAVARPAGYPAGQGMEPMA